MATTVRPQPGHITWPFTPETAQLLEKMFRTLYQDLRIVGDAAGAIPTVISSSVVAFPLLELGGPEDASDDTLRWPLPSQGSTGVLGATAGGTGQGAVSIGDLLYGSATDTWSRLTAGGVGRYLRGGGAGTAPVWSSIILPNSLPTAGGITFVNTIGQLDGLLVPGAAGTVIRSQGAGFNPVYSTFTIPDTFVKGDLVYASATSVLAGLADAAVGQLLISGGVGAVPSWSASPSVTGSLKSSGATAGIGYATGAGGTVTQLTDKATAVSLNTVTGEITMNAAALGADTTVTFVLNDTAIAATDMVLVQHISAGTQAAYVVTGQASGTGTANINVHNATPGSLSEAIVLKFVVFKAVTA